jgi:hypothetical protein
VASIRRLLAVAAKSELSGKVLFAKMKWFNEPASAKQSGDQLIVTTKPKTDYWRKTFCDYVTDNGHSFYLPVTGNFTLESRVAGKYAALYDQAGLMVRIDSGNWLKCGLELVEGVGHASVVVTTSSPTGRRSAASQPKNRCGGASCAKVLYSKFSILSTARTSSPRDSATARERRREGTITVIEGDHSSWFCYPQTAESSRAVQCLIDIQARFGGDSLIGRRLYPLLAGAGFRDVRVSPRTAYVDSSRPDLVEGVSKNTFIAMVEGVREQALGFMDQQSWHKGIADLYRATESDGTFCYTFFKALATR